MKLHAIGIALLISFTSVCFGMKKTITLPSAEVLKERLFKNGFDHFVEKTKIHEKLGGKSIFPIGVGVTVETCLYDYDEYLKKDGQEGPACTMAVLMSMRKPQIIQTILHDFPDELKELEEMLQNA